MNSAKDSWYPFGEPRCSAVYGWTASVDHGHDRVPEVAVKQLLSLGLLSSLLPAASSEIEQPSARPVGQQTQDLTEVALGLDIAIKNGRVRA